MEDNRTNINWLRRNLAKLISNLHKISIFKTRLLVYFDKNEIKRRVSKWKIDMNFL